MQVHPSGGRADRAQRDCNSQVQQARTHGAENHFHWALAYVPMDNGLPGLTGQGHRRHAACHVIGQPAGVLSFSGSGNLLRLKSEPSCSCGKGSCTPRQPLLALPAATIVHLLATVSLPPFRRASVSVPDRRPCS
jgi:hypothetical protein